MKIVCVIICEDHLVDTFGYHKAANSFSYFHPEIPVIRYGSVEIQRFRDLGYDFGSFLPFIIKEVKELHQADMVIELGSDTITMDRLDEMLIGDFDIAAGRNDPDEHTEYEGINRPDPIKNIPNHLFLNAHAIAITSDKFLQDWCELNDYLVKNKPRGILYWPMGEQGTMNILGYTMPNRFKVLDPLGSDLIYGASGNTIGIKDSNRIPESIKKYYNNCHSWKSWYDIELRDGKPWMHNRKVRLLHQCGGSLCEKLCFDWFHPDFLPFVKEITKCNE